MKGLFYINDTPANRISYWHLVGFLVTLPYDFFYSEMILVSFAAHTLIHCRRAYLRRILDKEVLILISIYLLGAMAILYSSDKAEGINVLTRQLSILLIPVLFSLNDIDPGKYREHLFTWFAFTCTCTVIYLYIDAIYTIAWFHLPLSSLFTLAFMNHNFSLPIEIHATYLSMYVAFSIIIFLYLISREKSRRLKYVYIACILVLAGGMLQLSSRAVFIALLVVINIVFPLLIKERKKRLFFICISAMLSLLVFFMIMQIDSFKTRYISELRKDLTQKNDLVEVNEPRMLRWKYTLELVSGAPVIGYGTGAEKQLLLDMYFEKKLYSSYINEFNTHNEYLSFLLKTGIIGLALFIYVLCFGFITAWRDRDLLFLSFMIMISITCISENVLDLNKGIFFYSFFFSLFLIKAGINNVPGLTMKSGNPR